MPKQRGSGGSHCTTKQKGLRNRGKKHIGTYARLKKSRDADRYGNYKEGKRVGS